MAKSPIGVIEVTFRGAAFPLRLTTKSILRAEREDGQGRGFNQILAEDFAASEHGPKFSVVVGMFKCLMWDHMPDALDDDAAEMIDALVGDHESVIWTAVNAAFPDPQETAASGE